MPPAAVSLAYCLTACWTTHVVRAICICSPQQVAGGALHVHAGRLASSSKLRSYRYAAACVTYRNVPTFSQGRWYRSQLICLCTFHTEALALTLKCIKVLRWGAATKRCIDIAAVTAVRSTTNRKAQDQICADPGNTWIPKTSQRGLSVQPTWPVAKSALIYWRVTVRHGHMASPCYVAPTSPAPS